MNTRSVRLHYHGTGGSLLGLVIGNLLLTILTLGIYSFWAKTRIRAFHYSQTELDGDRFAYHGTGRELWSGSIKASMVMFGLAVLVTVLTVLAGGESADPRSLAAIYLLFYVAILLLIPIAVTGARRYRLSRSSWRGIRFSFHGQWREYLGLTVKGTLFSLCTLGFYRPFFQNQRRAFLVDNARFGSERFRYDGDGTALFRQYLLALLLTIPTLGLCWVWYAAFRHRYFWEHTSMRGARFRSLVTGGDLLALHVTNLLLTVLTLGIATPWVMTRSHSFWCDNLALRGTVEWETILQNAQKAGSTAEGLAEAFDVDLGFVA
jgi:uncharacterized membrane protein YjgN (DUF898 family)